MICPVTIRILVTPILERLEKRNLLVRDYECSLQSTSHSWIFLSKKQNHAKTDCLSRRILLCVSATPACNRGCKFRIWRQLYWLECSERPEGTLYEKELRESPRRALLVCISMDGSREPQGCCVHSKTKGVRFNLVGFRHNSWTITRPKFSF